MGGFNSVTEALPSGKRTTASGVPLGNTASEDSGLAFAPSSAMAQQMPEQPDNGTGWKPNQGELERASRNLLDNMTPKPSSAFGDGLLKDDGEDDRALKPIFSKLAKEHPKNPVRLQGGLLGAPEPTQDIRRFITPINPNDPTWPKPKLPKFNWLAQRKQDQTPIGFASHSDLSESSRNLLDYPQTLSPRPDLGDQRPDAGSQIAAAPAAALAAPYVIEGAAAASTAAAAYWAAHPELHPKEPNWFSKMLGKSETSVADPEAAKPKIETFPSEAGKPPPLGGHPSEPPRLSGKEVFPAQETRKGGNIIHEQRPAKVDLPDVLDIRSINPVALGKGKSHPDMEKAIDNISDQAAQKATRLHIYGSGTLNGIGEKASNVIAPPVPRGQEFDAAKKDWKAFIRQANGDLKKVRTENDGVLVWESDDKSISANLHPSKSRNGETTFEVQIKEKGSTFQHKRRYPGE
ncbi:MAG: hypothetical protein HQL44_05655 [Alphaproteobacteria bacterium]|nr:hypothetical protein [Alphaproteobacteria bacterium]